MEIFRFIKWQWRQIHRDTKQVSLVTFCVIGVAIFCYLAGFSFIASLISVIATLALAVMLILLWDQTSEAWKNYQVVKEKEAQRIVNRLSGKF
jgi:hypothetical protein